MIFDKKQLNTIDFQSYAPYKNFVSVKSAHPCSTFVEAMS